MLLNGGIILNYVLKVSTEVEVSCRFLNVLRNVFDI